MTAEGNPRPRPPVIRATFVDDTVEEDLEEVETMLAAGEFEDGVPQNSTFEEGDWDGDLDFTSGYIVAAFTDGGYELGPKWQGAAAVPEPSSIVLL